jgi:hypothetical protein
MTKVKDEEGEVHVELTAEEARQDRLGKPALSVLSPCLAAGVVAFGLT